MIVVYGWFDQYQIVGLNTYPNWFGVSVSAITPSCRITTIPLESRSSTIASEPRNSRIVTENRNTSITC